jgi:hypothetical protein
VTEQHRALGAIAPQPNARVQPCAGEPRAFPSTSRLTPTWHHREDFNNIGVPHQIAVQHPAATGSLVTAVHPNQHIRSSSREELFAERAYARRQRTLVNAALETPRKTTRQLRQRQRIHALNVCRRCRRCTATGAHFNLQLILESGEPYGFHKFT